MIAGGMYPPLGGIKLLMEPASAQTAREILQETAPSLESTSDASPETSKSSPASNSPRVFGFNSGLNIGVIVGALRHFGYAYQRAYRDGIDQFDQDGDGVDEEIQVWRG